VGTRYLKPLADVERGSAWVLGGSTPAATVWQSLDGDSGTNPPTSDGDVDYTQAGNVNLPGANPPRNRVRALTAGTSPAIPVKKRGHTVKWTVRRAGAGTLTAWPQIQVWCNGVAIATSPAMADPGAAYVDGSYTLSESEAAAIDWTKDLDLTITTPTAGAGSCAARFTRLWFEYPDAWSLEASGSGELNGEAEGMLSNGKASGDGSLSGSAVGQIVNRSASGSGELNGGSAAFLRNVTASGSGSLNGQAAGFPGAQLVASGSGGLDGEAAAGVVYYSARGKSTSIGTAGGAQAVRGA
jgi:hypothetical protein